MIKYSSAYTDLAVEAHQMISEERGKELPGVSVETEEHSYDFVTRVKVTTEEGAKLIGKSIGNYITIDAPKLRNHDRIIDKEIGKTVARELTSMNHLHEDATILVVGLGNWNATPDALGPRVVDQVLVTRHLHNYAPELKGGTRPLCTIAPGVLGITGIETGEIIKGIVDKIKPNLVIAVDALAASSIERIGTTIQMADSGISPGSGVGNKRMGINEKSIGVPVIAIGVPTVVHAATIAFNTLNAIIESSSETHREEIKKDADKIYEKAIPKDDGSLFVTPKDIDVLIKDISRIIAGSINTAYQPDVDLKDMMTYLN